MAIRSESILSVIREVSEVLSISNEPQQLTNMALDTLSQVLHLDCCWVHTISSKSREPRLIAYHGFTPDMKRQVGSIDMDHVLGKEVIGLGHKIIIPDLSRDGTYGLSSFGEAGLRWLIVVPLMTYRMQGMMGVASRDKKRLLSETPELIMVIASLIGGALNKARLFQRALAREKQISTSKREVDIEVKTVTRESTELTDRVADSSLASDKRAVSCADDSFRSHARKMRMFRKSH